MLLHDIKSNFYKPAVNILPKIKHNNDYKIYTLYLIIVSVLHLVLVFFVRIYFFSTYSRGCHKSFTQALVPLQTGLIPDESLIEEIFVQSDAVPKVYYCTLGDDKWLQTPFVVSV
jgi:hypothetical protein